MSTSCGIPSSFTQGDSVSFSYGNGAYPPALWDLTLAMFKDGVSKTFTAVADTDGINFDFTLMPTQTAGLLPGQYVTSLAAISKDGTMRHTLARSCTNVAPDLTATFQPTPNMVLLASLKTAYGKIIAGTNKTVDFNGQSYTKRDLGELRKEMDRLQNIVNGELAALGLSTKGQPKTLAVQFEF